MTGKRVAVICHEIVVILRHNAVHWAAKLEMEKKNTMKSTIIAMFIVLVLMIVVPMLLLGDGDFIPNFGFGGGTADSGDEIEELRDKAPKNIKEVVTDKKVEVYKWKDENGVMQFSSTPPFEGGDSEMITLSPDTNIIDAIKIPAEEQKAEARPEVFSVGSPYSPDGMKKMIDGSKDATEAVNQRQTEQEKILQDILKQK